MCFGSGSPVTGCGRQEGSQTRHRTRRVAPVRDRLGIVKLTNDLRTAAQFVVFAAAPTAIPGGWPEAVFVNLTMPALERSRGVGMTRNSLVASFGLVAGLAAALSAQAPSSNGQVDPKTIQ